jgi:hypothetical protein
MSNLAINTTSFDIGNLSKKIKPIESICELIWNALDENAKNIKVVIGKYNAFGKMQEVQHISSVEVFNDGDFLSFHTAEDCKKFTDKGYSYKINSQKHGKEGYGRFKALRVGNCIEWFSDNKEGKKTHITLKKDTAKIEYNLDENVSYTADANNGFSTLVRITAIKPDDKEVIKLDDDFAVDFIANHFGLYLMNNPDVLINYNDSKILCSTIEENNDIKQFHEEYSIDKTPCQVKAIFWNNWSGDHKNEYGYYYHNCNGICKSKDIGKTSNLKAKLTVHLSSKYFDEENETSEMFLHDDIKQIKTSIQDDLMEWYNNVLQEQKGIDYEYIDSLQKQYLNQNKVDNPAILQRSRDIIDIISDPLKLYIPKQGGYAKLRDCFIRMVLELSMTNGDKMLDIINDTLKLEDKNKKQLIDICDFSGLKDSIEISYEVQRRLDIVAQLESLIYEETKQTVEKQLHKILEQNIWVFDENFRLTESEAGVSRIIREYLKSNNLSAIVDEDAKQHDGGRVDLFLSRIDGTSTQRKHLVVELKRPSVKIDHTLLGQIQKYALNISKGGMYSGDKWKFIAISKDTSEEAKGLLNKNHASDDVNYSIYLYEWKDILNPLKDRLHFVQQEIKNKIANSTSHLDDVKSETSKYRRAKAV